MGHFIKLNNGSAYQVIYNIGNFLGENLFLILGLLLGLVVVIIMRKTLNAKP